MAAKDYMVDVADIPKYGPPNMAAELYNMIRGVPKAYQEGKANEFANQKAEFEQNVEQPYKKKALERTDIMGDLTTRATQDYFNNRGREAPDFPSGESNNEPSPAQRLTQGTGGAKPGGQFSVADLTKGVSGLADQKGHAADIERILGIQPGARLTAKQEDAVRQMLKDAGGEEGESLTGSTGPSGLPPDPRTQAPPNLQPGMMGGPPNLAPGSPQGPVPMMSGAAYGGPPGVPAGPPGAPPGAAVAQAGPLSLAGGLAPYVRPQQPAPASERGAPELVPQERINQMRNRAQELLTQGQFVPQVAATNKARAEILTKAADEAQKARDAVAQKRAEATDPAIQQENTRKEIEKGNIEESRKEQKAIQMQGRTADESNQKLAVVRTQMSDPNFYTGAGHELVNQYRSWLVSMGADPAAATSVQTFNKTVNDLLGEKIRTMASSGYSRIQVAEIRQLQKSIANLDASPATNRYLVEEMSRLHQNEIKVSALANQYIKAHGYLDPGWPAAKEEFLQQPAQRLFTKQEVDHPESIAPPYFPNSMYHDVAKTKAFVRSQGLKGNDPVAVDDTTKEPGPDGVLPRKLVPAHRLLSITADTPAGR